MPAMPPPMTSAALVDRRGLTLQRLEQPRAGHRHPHQVLGLRGRLRRARCMCTHEHWSRMLAISNRYGFRPASRSVSWNSGSWVRGVQEATTTRLRLVLAGSSR